MIKSSSLLGCMEVFIFANNIIHLIFYFCSMKSGTFINGWYFLNGESQREIRGILSHISDVSPHFIRHNSVKRGYTEWWQLIFINTENLQNIQRVLKGLCRQKTFERIRTPLLMFPHWKEFRYQVFKKLKDTY